MNKLKRSSKLGRKIKHSASFKLQVVLESMKVDEVTSVARKHGINPTQLSTWRAYFSDHGSKIFQTSDDKQVEVLKKKISDLEQIIGRKEVEIGLLKNFLEN